MSDARAEQAELLQAILDTSVAAICVLDIDGQILFANQHAEQVLGLQASEIVGRRYDAPEWKSTGLDGSPWPDEMQPFTRVKESGEPVFDVRHAIEWPDGQRKLLSINGAPIKDEDGEVRKLVFAVTDITELVTTQSQKSESEQWLSLALESAQMGIWSWDTETDDVRWSGEVGPLFGIEPEEFGGKLQDYLDFVPPDDLEYVKSSIASALESEDGAYSMEHSLVWRDGSEHWIEGKGRVLRDAEGNVVRMQGTVADATAPKAAAEALRQSEEAFRSVLDTVPSYIVSIGPDHEIQFLNRTLPHLSIDDVIGKNVVEFMAEESREAYRRALDRAFATGEPQEVEALALQPEGAIPLLMRFGPVKSGDQVVSVTAVGVDVAQLKEAEQALLESQEQFLRAQRLESIGRLAGGLAHDFNNLLTAIIGSADLALTGLAESSEEEELVSEIRDAGERGAKLTKQLLAFASRQVVQPRVVDLNERIRRSEDLLRRLIGEHIDLSVDLAEGLWRVEVDPGRFEQVLVNLAVNARDAMPDGGRLSVSSANQVLTDRPGTVAAESSEWVAISVEDSGIGMDEETAGQVFEPFFTTKEAADGTGLGLSTCFGIVRQAGGFMEVESQPGRGAVFRVFLPRTRASQREGVMLQADRSGERGSEVILLVEDDRSVRRVTQKALEHAGYRVIEAGTADAARRAFAEHGDAFDLLISDVVMPHTNGAELAQEFVEQSPGLKVLFVSGYSPDDGPLRKMIGLGHQLMQKPFSGSELRSKVREVLDA